MYTTANPLPVVAGIIIPFVIAYEVRHLGDGPSHDHHEEQVRELVGPPVAAVSGAFVDPTTAISFGMTGQDPRVR